MEHKPVAHVLIFPFPAQGHVNSMLKLAQLLCLSDLHVTFLNTDHYHHRLLRFTDAQTRFSSFPNFRFESISDGLPDNHPRSIEHMKDLIDGIMSIVKPSFRELMYSDWLKSKNRPPITCIITDGLMSFPIDVAKELRIPSVAFRTASACYLWASFHFRELVQSGELPFPDADMDKNITNIPGMETVLRRRDLPSFYRANDLNDPFLQLATMATVDSTRATASILNTFEDLEGPIISEMSPHFPKIYAIGPLHALLSSHSSDSSYSSNSLFEVDRSCMAWLDSQPLESVVYVSFGSIVLMTHSEMLEFWHGLVNSGKRFLWVLRTDSVVDRDNGNRIPTELTEATKERGCIVGWSPQEEVLVHPAIGGFLTHSGWNSTLESIIAGVPMVCWPRMGDQQINSRFVSQVWKIGLDMKDRCDRLTVEKMVNDVMETKRNELMKSIDNISKMARKSVSEGGSSYRNLNALIEDIKTMSFRLNM